MLTLKNVVNHCCLSLQNKLLYFTCKCFEMCIETLLEYSLERFIVFSLMGVLETKNFSQSCVHFLEMRNVDKLNALM